jgi:hypothetical protein
MKTGKNKATNNFVIRLWSNKYYRTQNKNIYEGTITDVKETNTKHFHTAGELLKCIELLNKKSEKKRKITTEE